MLEEYESTRILPKGIRVVNKKKNLYERHAIEKVGYKQVDRVRDSGKGSLTMWARPFSKDGLLFVEKPDGFFQFGGYVLKEDE